MIDIDQVVRTALERRAGSEPILRMPERTARRVRLRQVRTVGAIACLTALAVLATVVAFNTVPHGRTAVPTSDGYASPLEDVPPGWPTVDVHDPATGYVPTLNDAGIVGVPRVLVFGTVDGSDFSLYGWTESIHGADQSCLGFAGLTGPGQPASAGPRSDYCTGDGDGVLQDSDLAVFGLQGSAPNIVANFGFVSRRVAEIWAGVDPQGFFQMPLIDGPNGWSASAFLFFPPAGDGSIEAYSRGGFDGGTALANASVCSPGAGPGTCRPDVHQLVPLTGQTPPTLSPPPPGAWPDVTYGGDFAPYVDHEATSDGVVDPGVVGDKTPISWGTVQGVPWSLTAFAVRNADGWTGSAGPGGQPGPAGQLFVGADGAFGGGGVALYGTTPWEPTDFSMTGFGFGSGPLTAYAGVVSNRVANVQFQLDEGQTREVELVPGPAGVDAKYFVLFTPNGATGTALAYASDGSELGRQALCVPATIDANSNLAC